ncbi:MAG: hypothetical protein PUE29_08145, partial [Olsenella sp.]|nr:hypothetical protein [Olsenella sp.]
DRGPSGGGRPAAPRGAIYKVREIKDIALLKTLQLGERSSGAISDCNGTFLLFSRFAGALVNAAAERASSAVQ